MKNTSQLITTPLVLVLLLALTLVCLQTARADWQGKLHITVVKGKDGKPTQIEGVMRMKKEFTRLDVSSPMDVSTIIDKKNQKTFALLHAQKMVMETDMKKSQIQAPICSTTGIEKCLEDQGFKKVGNEQFDGHPCALYEGDMKQKDKSFHIKLWRPEDLKEVPWIKSTGSDGNGTDVETHISDVQVVNQADSYFKVPAEYKSMGNLQDLMKSFQKPKGT